MQRERSPEPFPSLEALDEFASIATAASAQCGLDSHWGQDHGYQQVVPSTSGRPPSPKRCKMGHDDDQGALVVVVPDSNLPVWPANDIPVEIFELITSYLTRSEVTRLRLVCKEFESKVSAQYFKNVVVPFRSELYSSLRDGLVSRQHTSSALFGNGLRIFESFGPHIRRFALSLEIDEDALAHPPLKPVQEAVPSFWGIYRWPHQTYNRYSDLESIEQTADETQGMKNALRCLSRVSNLGLCCDAGLGFLLHPDLIARMAATKQPVFSTQNWRREQRATMESTDEDDVVTITDFNGFSRPLLQGDPNDPVQYKQMMLEKMVTDSGFTQDQTDEAIQLLLDTEDISLAEIEFEDRDGPRSTPDARANREVRRWVVTSNGSWAVTPLPSSRREASNSSGSSDWSRRHPLIPANLSQAQKEVLLELEWASRAMIQSYVIAMVDNASMGYLNSLTTLTIAKIPSSHLHILFRDDFWGSFPNLTNVSLGVIADWRRITKPAPGCIDDQPVSPLLAVGAAHTLLNNFIGKQQKIESLHFEWICGGELAPSFSQRNQYILPAPFLAQPEHMASATSSSLRQNPALSLPHIKHLSLKNCWVSPHVFLQTIRQMGLASLEKLELEGVSLSGRPTTEHQIPLGQNQGVAAGAPHGANIFAQSFATATATANGAGAAPLPAGGGLHFPGHHGANMANGNAGGQPSHQPGPAPFSLRRLEVFTWSGMLEHFSPALNTRQKLACQDYSSEFNQESWGAHLGSKAFYVPEANRLIADETEYKIKCLSFRSCGYVSIDSSYLRTREVFPDSTNSLGSPSMTDLQMSIHRLMQRATDKLLGRTVPYMHDQEMFVLARMFGMHMGWDGVYSRRTILEALGDSIESPGAGRFSGVLEENQKEVIWTGFTSEEDQEDSEEAPELVMVTEPMD